MLTKKTTNSFLFVFFFLFSLFGFSQDLHIKSHYEKIKVLQDSSFVNEVTVNFSKSETIRLFPIFFDSELEKVTDIKLFSKKRRRLKSIPIKKIYEEDVKLDYITSQKVKSVTIPAGKDIQLKYTIACKELMYFSNLPLFSYNKIDTLKYQINIPKQFKLSYNTIHKDSLPYYKIDSVKTDINSTFNISLSPKKITNDPLQLFGIYKNMKAPLMRILVTPIAYKNQPKKYLNDWYLNNIAPLEVLNEDAKKKIDQLTANVDDPKKIIKIIYDYVKSNFKYVAIEIGMGAFIPSHPNEVYLNKQGDCKDLSYFLAQALRYKGIKSNVALAATFDHISDCDYPSLSSANHVICVAYVGKEKILLDPTDPIHQEETPVQSLQDRTIFIVNTDGGSFYKVEPFTPIQNKIDYTVDLQLDSKKQFISGIFNVKYNGISGNHLKREIKEQGKKDFMISMKLFYELVFGNQSVSELTSPKELVYKGKIAISGKTFDDNLNKYIFIDFLPKLLETQSRESLIEGTYLRNPFHKKVRIKIKLDQPIESFKEKTHSFNKDGISLNLIVRAISNTEIECNYDFSFDHIFINSKNIDSTNNVLSIFKKIINDPIVLKKQKI